MDVCARYISIWWIVVDFKTNVLYYIYNDRLEVLEFTVMALNDLYQLTLNQTLFGRDIQNTFFYERQDPAGNAADLGDNWRINILPSVLGVQSALVDCVSIAVINLGDLGDFITIPDSSPGGYGEVDTLPAFNAVGYSLRLNTRAVRPGSKRVAGVPEEASLNGVLVNPTYLTRVETLRVALYAEVTGADASYFPVVVKRIKEPVAGTVPPKFTYRLPTTGDPVTIGTVVSALSNPDVTSQTSRKD